MTNVQSLRDLYLKLGGSLSDTYSDIADGIKVGDYNTIADMVQAVTKVAGGGSALPEVTAADNGDVLTVVEGAWAKAEPSAELPEVTAADNGKNLSVVDGSWAASVPSVYQISGTAVYLDGSLKSITLNTTVNQLRAAFEANRVVIGSFTGVEPEDFKFHAGFITVIDMWIDSDSGYAMITLTAADPTLNYYAEKSDNDFDSPIVIEVV